MTKMLDYFAAQYYAGTPVISDEEFDSLADYFAYEGVGAPVIGDRIAHAFGMFSLQKCYDDEPLIDLPGEVVQTCKLDGAAVANYYVFGKHVLSLTRGDGKEGLDITDKMRTLIPQEIQYGEVDLVQVTGEIVAPKTIENARNYAAGALNLKSIEEFKTRDLSFIAYGITPNQYDTWTEDMLKLTSVCGFNTVYTAHPDDLDQFPQDGVVYRLDSYEAFDKLGYTAKHPRGAFALKERKGGVVTKLLRVDWQVGRSGVVSPVAILEPVIVGEAKVARATLHNMKYIEELGLEEGCLVEVIRSGEIIPRIVRRIYD